MQQKYYVEEEKDGLFVLKSKVKTSFGSEAVNFVASGTEEYVLSLKERLSK